MTMIKRRLRVVPDCPQPETPIKPVEYGAAPWGKLPPTPTADQLTIRCRAQSLLCKGGTRAELPGYEEAQRILARANKPRIRLQVAVPPNLPASPDACSCVRSGGAGRQFNQENHA